MNAYTRASCTDDISNAAKALPVAFILFDSDAVWRVAGLRKRSHFSEKLLV